jgi:arsenate reductase (thioredoxin)
MKHLIAILPLVVLLFPGYSQVKKIIFVCEHGAAKSVIAATYFNQLAKERNLNWEGVCRGTTPDAALTQGTIEGLQRDSLLNKDLVPEKLSINDTSNAVMIIRFTTLPEDFKTNLKQEDWSSLPNLNDDYSKRRDALVKRLNVLLDSLENKQ